MKKGLLIFLAAGLFSAATALAAEPKEEIFKGKLFPPNIILENQAESDLLFRNAHTQYYGIDVSGGSDAFTYFIAGSAGFDDGVTLNSSANKYNGRVNVSAQPSDDLTITANAGIGLTRIQLPSDYPYEDAVYADPSRLGEGDARRGYQLRKVRVEPLPGGQTGEVAGKREPAEGGIHVV